MTLNIGVIGVGMIGREHISRLANKLVGAKVVALADVNAKQAEETAAGLQGVKVYPTGEALIAAPEVQAVVVTSWGPTHETYVLASIKAGKPVFCEKPLATTAEACLRIVDAEIASGRHLVQVGFQRRYDKGYRALKKAIDDGVDRSAADGPLRASQSVRAGGLRQRHGDRRHVHSRDRRSALAHRRRLRLGAGDRPPQHETYAREAGRPDHGPARDQERRADRRRGFRQLPIRL